MSQPMQNASAGKKVYLIGPQKLQNSLLTSFIAKNASDCESELVESPSQITNIAEETLFLVDFGADGAVEAINSVEEFGREKNIIIHMAFINVIPDFNLSPFVERPYFNGAFFLDCSQEQLLKGVTAIFDGEIWLPRKLLSQFMRKNRTTTAKPIIDNDLTDREIEVLSVLATGAKNSEIAEKLDLSPHTVKTHIYNIFKKIDASNRLQAVNWAKQHLE